jgi:hypothetical protein
MVVSHPRRRLLLLLGSALATLTFLVLSALAARETLSPLYATVAFMVVTFVAVAGHLLKFLPTSSKLVLIVPFVLMAVMSGLDWLQLPKSGTLPVVLAVAVLVPMGIVATLTYRRERRPVTA